ncbi:MAG: hypothetical protein F7C34_00250 [Desulfurococcales archaeon]|nr:hypothetical protein [Desulfurococcales archaeon]
MPRRKRLNEYFSTESSTEQRGTAQSRAIDRSEAELIAKIAAEKVFALMSGRIISALDKCLEKLEKLEKRLDMIEKSLQAGGLPGQRGRPKPQLRRGKGRLAERLEEYLDKHRFLLLSESRHKLGAPASRVREAADEIGAVQLELEGDIAILMPEHLEEFDALLAEAKSPDPLEAARKLGVYAQLFERMRRSGLVYYDSAKGYWRRLE